jgi:hypothetical protein
VNRAVRLALVIYLGALLVGAVAFSSRFLLRLEIASATLVILAQAALARRRREK